MTDPWGMHTGNRHLSYIKHCWGKFVLWWLKQHCLFHYLSLNNCCCWVLGHTVYFTATVVPLMKRHFLQHVSKGLTLRSLHMCVHGYHQNFNTAIPRIRNQKYQVCLFWGFFGGYLGFWLNCLLYNAFSTFRHLVQ